MLKTYAKKIIPKALWKTLSNTYWWWINRGNHQLAGLFSSQRRKSVRKLQSYRDLHAGERCFILGNGPSLREMDLALLQDEITFGMNRIYLLFSEMGYQTTYYLAINTLVIEQSANDIASLPMPKFISWRGRNWMDLQENTVFIDTDFTPPADFASDSTGRIFEGSTVTYVAMQLAFYMGFQKVYIIGVDHSFHTKGPPNTTVAAGEVDQNHFSPDYFSNGYRWQLPDLEASEEAYQLAKITFEKSGRQILDATIGGKLTIFPKVEYHSLFR